MRRHRIVKAATLAVAAAALAVVVGAPAASAAAPAHVKPACGWDTLCVR
jgi:hypothetical protein